MKLLIAARIKLLVNDTERIICLFALNEGSKLGSKLSYHKNARIDSLIVSCFIFYFVFLFFDSDHHMSDLILLLKKSFYLFIVVP